MQSQLSESGTLLGFIEGEKTVLERRVGEISNTNKPFNKHTIAKNSF